MEEFCGRPEKEHDFLSMEVQQCMFVLLGGRECEDQCELKDMMDSSH